MIARLTGKVIDREDRALIVDVNGLGYRVVVLSPTREKFAPGSDITLRIHHHVGEDAEDLFGFETDEYLKTFTLLLTVPSVGVRTAMNILEIAPPRILAQAVAEEDITLLTKVSGVGKKTAQRLLVELKEKMKAPKEKSMPGSIQEEAMEALVSIGYTTAQARVALSNLPKDIKTVEQAVRAALQQKAG
jgi:Holliday junction DNA helicase RuvA